MLLIEKVAYIVCPGRGNECGHFFTFHVETCHGLEASPKLFHTNEFNGAQRNFWEMASIVFCFLSLNGGDQTSNVCVMLMNFPL